MAVELLDRASQNYLEGALMKQMDGIIQRVMTPYESFTRTVTGSTLTLKDAIIDMTFPFTAWTGMAKRVVPQTADFSVTAATYQGGFTITDQQLKYDKTGTLRRAVESKMPSSVESLQLFIESQIFGLFATIASDTSWLDGVAMAATTHTWPAGEHTTSQGNLLTTAFSASQLAVVEESVLKFKDMYGNPIGMGPFTTLVHDYDISADIADVLDVSLISTGGDNRFKGKYNPICNRWSSGTKEWYLLRGKPIGVYFPDTLENCGIPNPSIEIARNADAKLYTVDITVDLKPFWVGDWWNVFANVVS